MKILYLKNRFLKLFGYIYFLQISCLDAKIEDHLKKAPNKTSIHQIQNIDFIYMINLDQRPEKFKKCIEQLHPFEIYPYRFSAVNGWELSLEAINDVGVQFTSDMQGGFPATTYPIDGDFQPVHEMLEIPGKTYFCHGTTRGSIGIVLSHLSVLQDAWDSGYETIWVMEDDIEVMDDPRKIPDLINQLDLLVDKNWDILFTDLETRDKQGNFVPCSGFAKRPNFTPSKKDRFFYFIKSELNDQFIATGARFGAYSMIIRRRGMEKILNFWKKYNIFLPFDMDFYLPEGIKLFTTRNAIISSQPCALTDNADPNYKKDLK